MTTALRDALRTALRSYRDEMAGNRLEESQAVEYLKVVQKRRAELEALIVETETALADIVPPVPAPEPAGKED